MRNERARRVALVNTILAPLRVRVSDWQASSYIVSSSTGRREIVPDIQAVWTAVEKLTGRPLDPLDPDYLTALGRSARGAPG